MAISTRPDRWEDHIKKPPEKKIQKYMLIDGKVHETHRIIVFRIRMGDVEDPDLMVAHPIYEWQQTEVGKFIMEKALEPPMWHRNIDHTTYGHVYTISAYLKDTDHTFWQLKWGQNYLDNLK